VVDLLFSCGSQFRSLLGAQAGANLIVEPGLRLRQGGFIGGCLGAEAAKDIEEVGSAGGAVRLQERRVLQDDSLH